VVALLLHEAAVSQIAGGGDAEQHGSSDYHGSSAADDDGEVIISRVVVHCPWCERSTPACLRRIYGHKNNLMLFGHWDGWQPFTTSCTHSCGSIEIQVANMTKSARAKAKFLFPLVFVPAFLSQCGEGRFDVFLAPLRDELVRMFVDGFSHSVAGHSPPTRVQLLLWEGDMPAQAELCKVRTTNDDELLLK
jgi:hypothetical protein